MTENVRENKKSSIFFTYVRSNSVWRLLTRSNLSFHWRICRTVHQSAPTAGLTLYLKLNNVIINVIPMQIIKLFRIEIISQFLSRQTQGLIKQEVSREYKKDSLYRRRRLECSSYKLEKLRFVLGKPKKKKKERKKTLVLRSIFSRNVLFLYFKSFDIISYALLCSSFPFVFHPETFLFSPKREI